MRPSVIRQAIAGHGIFPESRRHIFLAAAIVAVTLLVYIPAMRGGFFWDDDIFLTHNKLIASADGLRLFWSTTQAPDYFPLTSSALWVEWRLWGNHAGGYHVVNVLLHAISAVLLWRVLLRLRIPGAWLAGLLFALHPVAVASAAWIAELKNTLPMVLYLLSLLAWLRFDECGANAAVPTSLGGMRRMGIMGRDASGGTAEASPHSFIPPPLPTIGNRKSAIGNYVLSLVLFLLALLAKTSVVMLPAVLLLCAWWRRGEVSRKDFLRSAPFFALSLALGLVTIWFQQHNSIGSGEIVQPEDMATRVVAAGWIVWFYLFKLLLPVGLCAIYPRWSVDGSSALAFLPIALLIAVAAVLWANRKGWGRAPLFAMAYFAVTLLPVLGWVDMAFMRLSLVADHLQYTAMVGVLALVAGVAATACSAGGPKGRAGKFAVAGCVAVLGVLTWGRASLYADAPRLWQDNLSKNPGAWMAWDKVGLARTRAGRCVEAVQCFDRALALPSDRAKVYNNRALAYAGMGRYDLAVSDYDRALALDPRLDRAWNNRALARIALRQYDLAVGDSSRAIELKADDLAAYYTRAVAYYRMKAYDKAWTDVKMFVHLGGRPDPGFLKALTQAAQQRKKTEP